MIFLFFVTGEEKDDAQDDTGEIWPLFQSGLPNLYDFQ